MLNAAYITPAVTFLDADGHPDSAANAALYEHLIRGGVDGILVLGSIGEFFALSMADREAAAMNAVRAVRGRTRLIVGTASMLFDEIAPFSNRVLAAGADAVILISPYYFPLADEQVFAYFDRLAGAIRGPVYLYSFPQRTGYGISPDVARRLAEKHPNVAGIKDTIPGMDHTRALIEAVKPVRPDFEVYSGFDENLSANVIAGGNGCIAGLSNIAPALCAGTARAWREGDLCRAAQGQRLIQKLFALYAIGSNFIPVIKQGVCLAGVPGSPACTFPLPGVTAEETARLARLIEDVGAEAARCGWTL